MVWVLAAHQHVTSAVGSDIQQMLLGPAMNAVPPNFKGQKLYLKVLAGERRPRGGVAAALNGIWHLAADAGSLSHNALLWRLGSEGTSCSNAMSVNHVCSRIVDLPMPARLAAVIALQNTLRP